MRRQRRRRRTYLRSFSHGLMLAALPVLAFLGVDYLVAPPADSGENGSILATAIRDGSWRSAASPRPSLSPRELATQSAASVPAAASSRGVAPPVVSRSSERSYEANLATSIQQELVRVGCYAGNADGSWDEGTRSAMRAFNASVRVKLATDRPDYILLTLLQGHSAKACTRACDGDAARSGACHDKSIQAGAPVPAVQPTDAVAAPSSGLAKLSSVVIPAPIVIDKSSAVAPAGAGVVKKPAEHKIAAQKPAVIEPFVTSSSPAAAAPVAAQLPGRMAIGANEVEAAAAPIAAPLPPQTAPVTHAAKSRPAPSVQPRQRPSDGGSRVSRMFSDLSRHSP